MHKYMQILTDLHEQIDRQAFGAGGQLPSIREMSITYSCSKSTVIRAYQELERNHLIYSVPQSGYYVVGQTGRHEERPPGLDFSSPSPDLEVLPYSDFVHCIHKATELYKYSLFTYGDAEGLPALRQTLVSHLTSNQVFTQAERICITSGIQQALMILTRMRFPNGNHTILVEQPTYDLYLRFLELEQYPIRGIKRGVGGLDLNHLEQIFQTGEIKFFYTMPRFQNPLGTSYTQQERRAIAALARRYHVYIVEDDYLADLDPDRQAEPLFSSAGNAPIVYLKSFSKVLFPGLRLGAVVLPESLRESFSEYKRYAALDTSALNQAALHLYVKNGMFERHKQTIQQLYRDRIQHLHQLLAPYQATGIGRVASPPAGIYTRLALPRSLNLEQLMKRLQTRGISALSGKNFYMQNYPEQEKFLRLSITRIDMLEMEYGVCAIMEEVERASRSVYF